MAYPVKHFFTPAEYLTLEEIAETKHEYFNGEIFDMVGVSRNHNLITVNMATSLSQSLRDKPCEVYSVDMRLLVRPSGLYTYPDVMVVCGTPEFIHRQTDTLTNPTVIVEVLSPSTRVYDRGQKFELYKALPSLRDYVLVEQNRVYVEVFQRAKGSRKWNVQTFDNLKQTMRVPSIACAIPLGEIYHKVQLES